MADEAEALGHIGRIVSEADMADEAEASGHSPEGRIRFEAAMPDDYILSRNGDVTL